MSFNSKAYLEYEERRLDPDSVIRTGSRRRYQETTQAAKNRFYNQLTEQERQQLATEYENEIKNRSNDWK